MLTYDRTMRASIEEISNIFGFWYFYYRTTYLLLWGIFSRGLNNNQIRSEPTLSLGIIFKSLPNLRKTSPQFWSGLIPTPSIVKIEVVFSSTRNYIDDSILSHRRIWLQQRRGPHLALISLCKVAISRKWGWLWRWLCCLCSYHYKINTCSNMAKY